MSAIEQANKKILEMIDTLTEEFNRDGFLNTPSEDRKKEIVKQIAKLRASMNPKSPNEK